MKRGFALPTVLVATTVMIFVLFTALAAAASMGGALDEQYYNKLAREAAESGVSRARSCYPKVKSTATSSQWPNNTTLTPKTNCLGANVTSQSANVLDLAGDVRTRFEVARAQVDNGVIYFEVRGYAERLRSSNQATPVATYVQVIKYRVRLTQSGIVSGKKTVCSIVGYRLYCWGRNNESQIPGQPVGNVTRPVEVEIKSGSTQYYVQAVAAGWSHVCAITSLQPVVNYNLGNQTQVWCWGANYDGQLGVSNFSEVWSMPTQVKSSLGLDFANRNFTAISARNHTCIVGVSVGAAPASGGSLYCWGHNNNGQAGGTDFSQPRLNASAPVVSSTGNPFNNVVNVSAIGPATTCFINGKTPYCMGSPDVMGRVPAVTGTTRSRGHTPGGDSTTNPLRNNSQQVTVDWNHACALTMVGEIYCWGSNANPDTGWDGRVDPAVAASQIDTPIKITPAAGRPTTFVQVSTGSTSTCAIAIDQRVWCWGNNDQGQLGQGQVGAIAGVTDANGRVSGSNMLRVDGMLAGRDVKEITTGGHIVCAITTEEEVFCWGGGSFGNLGNGTTGANPSPDKVKFVPGLLY